MEDQIGAAAGTVWRHLDGNQPITLAKLKQSTKLSEQVLLMSLGWLAREGKVDLVRTGTTLRVSLRHHAG